MTTLAYLKARHGHFEVIGVQGERTNRDETHRARMRSISRDFNRAQRNAARAETHRIMDDWDRAERWQRLAVRRLVRLRSLSERMSVALWEGGR